MPGRKPKTVQQQIAEGDPAKRGVHKLDQKLAAAPKPIRGLPNCPAHLTGRAREAWDNWREDLESMNLDSRPDAMMLEGACVNYARAVEADEAITKDGLEIHETIYDKDGDEVGYRRKSHPLIAVSNMSWRNVKGFCSEFGLSPVSRTRLTIDRKDDGEAEMNAQLSQPRPEKKASVQ